MPTTSEAVPQSDQRPRFLGIAIPEFSFRRRSTVAVTHSSEPRSGGEEETSVTPTTSVPSTLPQRTTSPGQAILSIETPGGSPKTHHEPVRPPKRRRYGVNPIAESAPYDFECARLELLKLLELRRDGDAVSYDVRDILRRSILDHDGMATMFVHELVRRLADQTEKRYDMVVSIGEYGAIFGARIADALIAKYGQGHDVVQRFLELFTPPAPAEGGTPPSEYRLQRGRSDKGYLLSGKRIVFAVPVVTPEIWPEVLRQAAFLRGEQANSDAVCIVAIARLGRLMTDAPHGLRIDAIIDVR